MSQPIQPDRSGWAYFFGILGTFLILAALAYAIHRYTQPVPLGAARAEERAKALAEMRAAEHEALTTPAWIDQKKGLVRLPIDTAMQIVQREWLNPPAARSNLIAREEKASALPPKAPEKPSPFE